jgi:hypothetical protein
MKKIIAITTITTVAATGLASAQATSTLQDNHSNFLGQVKSLLQQNGLKSFGSREMHGNKLDNHTKMMMKFGNKNNDRKAIEAAIIAGDWATFQTVASSSPLKNLSQETFNLLTPQFQAKKNAEDNIRNILSQAGVKK